MYLSIKILAQHCFQLLYTPYAYPTPFDHSAQRGTRQTERHYIAIGIGRLYISMGGLKTRGLESHRSILFSIRRKVVWPIRLVTEIRPNRDGHLATIPDRIASGTDTQRGEIPRRLASSPKHLLTLAGLRRHGALILCP